MATKPATTPEIWASNAVYTTGPFIGSAAKALPGAAVAAEGHRPGALFPTAAEHENYEAFWLTTWVTTWLALGSSAGAADAHPVETDAVGRSQLQGLTLNDAVDETVLSVTGINTFAPALLVTSLFGGPALQADIGNANAIGVSSSTGTGANATGAFVAMAATPAGGSGVRVLADGGTAGTGVRVVHGGSGYALDILAAGPVAARFSGDVGDTVAATFMGTGTGEGIAAQGGANAQSAITSVSTNNTGYSVGAVTPMASTSTARSGHFEARGMGVALEARASDGYALYLQGPAGGAPTWPTAFFLGQGARPLVAAAGSLTFLTSENQFVHATTSLLWRGVWTSPGGKATAYGCSANGAQLTATTVNDTDWEPAVTISATGDNAPKVAGREAVLRFTAMACAQNALNLEPTLDLQFYDVTAGAVIAGSTRSGVGVGLTDGFKLGGGAYGFNTAIVYEFRFTIPAAGNRQWRAEIKAGSNATGNVVLRDCSLTLDGLH